MAATKAKKQYRTPGVVNGSLAYDFNTLERQLDRTGRMTPDRAYGGARGGCNRPGP